MPTSTEKIETVYDWQQFFSGSGGDVHGHTQSAAQGQKGEEAVHAVQDGGARGQWQLDTRCVPGGLAETLRKRVAGDLQLGNLDRGM